MKATLATISALAVMALGAQFTTVTHTTYLPFEQHPCANFYAIDQVSPEQACEVGACCVQIVGIGEPTGVLLPPDSTDEKASSQVVCTQSPCTDKPIVLPPVVKSKTGTEAPVETTAPNASSVEPNTNQSGTSTGGSNSATTEPGTSDAINTSSEEPVSTGEPSASTEEPGTTTEVLPTVTSERIFTTTVTSDVVETITTTETKTSDGVDPITITTPDVETITTEEPITETITTSINGTVITETITTEEPVTETITTPDVETITTEEPITETITTSISGTVTTETITTEEPVTETITTPDVETITTEEPITETITTSINDTVTTETITTEEPVTETITTPEVKTITPTPEPPKVTTETKTTTSEEILTLTETGADIPTPPTSSPRPVSTTTSDDPTCPTPTCKTGIDRAVYNNPFKNDLSSTYESFDPDYFKSAKPKQVDVVDEIYISTLRGDTTYEDAGAEYRAFLFACQNGTYTFTSPYSDDITILWFGEKAYKGWTRDNADIIQFYYGNNNAQSVKRDIVAGTYYPIRVMWGNTGGAADLELKIFAPDGRQLLGTDGTSYLTTDACDGSYPPYEAFGEET